MKTLVYYIYLDYYTMSVKAMIEHKLGRAEEAKDASEVRHRANGELARSEPAYRLATAAVSIRNSHACRAW